MFKHNLPVHSYTYSIDSRALENWHQRRFLALPWPTSYFLGNIVIILEMVIFQEPKRKDGNKSLGVSLCYKVDAPRVSNQKFSTAPSLCHPGESHQLPGDQDICDKWDCCSFFKVTRYEVALTVSP